MDVDAIAPGADFGARIDEAIDSCSLLIALIGDDWLDIADPAGRRRLDDPTDLVRREVASALGRSDLLVIPVLVEGAQMPRPEQLPDELKSLTRRNAFELSDARWRFDVDRLIEVAQGVLPPGSPQQPPRAGGSHQRSEATITGTGPVAPRATGHDDRATPRSNHTGCLVGAVIALVVIGVVAAVIITTIFNVLGAITGEDDGPAAERLVKTGKESAGGLTLTVVSVKQTKRSTRVEVVARNNTKETLMLPLFGNCSLRSSSGVTLQAEPHAPKWTQALPPGGDRQRGTIVFEDTLPAASTRASLSFSVVYGSLSGPDSITVSGITLRRP